MAREREDRLVPLADGKLVARGRIQPIHEPMQAPTAEAVGDAVAELVGELIDRCPAGWHVAHVSVKKDRAWRPASERSRYFGQAFFSREPTPA